MTFARPINGVCFVKSGGGQDKTTWLNYTHRPFNILQCDSVYLLLVAVAGLYSSTIRLLGIAASKCLSLTTSRGYPTKKNFPLQEVLE